MVQLMRRMAVTKTPSSFTRRHIWKDEIRRTFKAVERQAKISAESLAWPTSPPVQENNWWDNEGPVWGFLPGHNPARKTMPKRHERP